MGQGQNPTLKEGTGESPTPEQQADSPATQQQNPPENRPETEEPERLRQQLAGSSREAKRLKAELDKQKQENQLLNWQLGQRTPQAPTQGNANFANPVSTNPNPTAQQTEYGESFLTPEEESQLLRAEENLDNAAANRLRNLQLKRSQEQATKNVLTGLYTLAQYSQVSQPVIQQLEQAEELKDPDVRRKIMSDSVTVMQNPTESSRYVQGQWNAGEYGVLNPHVVLDKLKDYRIQASSSASRARTAANETAYVPDGDESSPQTANPDPSETFDPGRHLTESERSAVRKAIAGSAPGYEGIEDVRTGYKRFWDRMPESRRSSRIKTGQSGSQSVSGNPNQQGGLLWRASKKK